MPVYFKQTIKDQQRNTCTTYKTCLQDNLNSILYTVNNKITKSGHLNNIYSCIIVCHLESRSRHNPSSWPHPIDLGTSSPSPEYLDENVHHALCSHLPKFDLKSENASSAFLVASCSQACSMFAAKFPRDIRNYLIYFFLENHAQHCKMTAEHLFLKQSFCLLIPWNQAFVESVVL